MTPVEMERFKLAVMECIDAHFASGLPNFRFHNWLFETTEDVRPPAANWGPRRSLYVILSWEAERVDPGSDNGVAMQRLHNSLRRRVVSAGEVMVAWASPRVAPEAFEAAQCLGGELGLRDLLRAANGFVVFNRSGDP